MLYFFFFQAEDGIRDAQESRGLGDVYKRQKDDFDLEEVEKKSDELNKVMQEAGKKMYENASKESTSQSSSDNGKVIFLLFSLNNLDFFSSNISLCLNIVSFLRTYFIKND